MLSRPNMEKQCIQLNVQLNMWKKNPYTKFALELTFQEKYIPGRHLQMLPASIIRSLME
ncbi:hypothetical protein GLOIN_2v1701830 [Rhizophagus irregularis DAOM 181602=DAOM 197198]|uniref:Uncharacterized protein n=1 Tax=Rhizophagus irregularis (strain DAOM 181602 / DAOM 197198 / MUCL 43194) TaxID=747089 RepID=A0A2P4P8M7_RHIID|nr:hypothetical protein GLOIN_2v1701830 [Rhizophagus irregularis DAOM 181602=DAOM 197198]POG61748.1 hypothetical protein GLOIN_2v1701830 [Rhizophagus irregularis DAOM 181602=DAOM 197198]|eukprot:XP_025168614.1 hypothetical protein GLOIN_2v1701830 [Rhizophagus irregularis DAOM 181602=DAOM 197198]